MKCRRQTSWVGLAIFLTFTAGRATELRAQSSAPGFTNPPIIISVEGTNVWVQRVLSAVWEKAYPQQVLQPKDRGRTGRHSFTSIRLTDLSVMRIGQLSEFEIKPLPSSEKDAEAEFSLWRGLLYLLHRDRPGKHRFVTPAATAATRGTEFTLEVEAGTGRTVLTVLEGEAELTNPAGTVQLTTGEQGVAVLGQPPTKTAVLDILREIQWCLYYPAILDVAELALPGAAQTDLRESLLAYAQGDLLRAVETYPADRVPGSDAERLYAAALLLAVGEVRGSESLLAPLAGGTSTPRESGLAAALRLMITTVQQRSGAAPDKEGGTATEALAASYYHQGQSHLELALGAARQAVSRSPGFAFAWARVAELEFSRGHIAKAMSALDRSLALAPRNAQALALKGFLLSAENRTGEALQQFEQAIAIDAGLGNAWLGRGLCRIRRGEAAEGRLDLQVAAVTEPQRSLLRSYLGKAFSNAGDDRRGGNELAIARQLDAGDPTPWLYSALLEQQRNRINRAVTDLERSQQLNDNRRVYRSGLLLDQDRAVRGANLASIYRDAGMLEVSVAEAGRAVTADYANYSAHLFLANSFNQLRDLKQVNLRYETAWFNEQLLANLLSPVGAGTLAQTVSQQEYSKLFERDRLGFNSSTEYLSHGEWIQNAVQYGIFKNSSYSAELFYHTSTCQRCWTSPEYISNSLS